MMKYNVLLVDDHILFREGFASLLKGDEFIEKIYHAGAEDEAFGILNTHKIDLVFMDINLVETSGIELTKKIRQQFLNIKIIALSMYADRSNLLKMLWAGTDGYLPKNTTFEEVNTAIQIVMCDESYFSQTLLTIMKSNMLSDEELTAKYGGYEELSKREIEILVLICQSYTTNEIAKKLLIAPKTVESHRASILSKIQAKSLVDVVIYAFDKGLLNSITH